MRLAINACATIRGVTLALLLSPLISSANARDLTGKYANSPLKEWFDSLASGKGLCCSFADGVSIKDVDWDTASDTACLPKRAQDCSIHYRVRLEGRWIVVPDSAVVTEPNRFGAAVVWPYTTPEGSIAIRCFIPGSGA